MQRMESHEGSPDLVTVRPDRNQGCTSSSPSSLSRADKVDLTSLSIYELEEAIKRHRLYLKKLSMKDDNAKLNHRLHVYEDELARRLSCKETENQVIPVEAVERLHSEPNSAKKRPEVFDLEAEFAISGRQIPKSSPKKGYSTIAVDCDKEDGMPSPALTKEEEVNEIQYLDKSPPILNIKACSECHQAITSQCNEVDGCVHCSICKKNIVSSLANGHTTVSSTRCGFTRLNGRSGPAKRSQQAIGDTIETALELSDDEELKEVVPEEPSSSGNFLKRKCMRNASDKLAGAKFLYPSSCDLEAVEVRYADLCHLAPTEFLNDTVIDFYMKYMQMNLLEEKDRLHRFHFFSCFFYKKLTSSKAQGKDWFEKLHKWTKGINIFKKVYLFIPIHNSCHWSLAIVCFPAGQRVPLILHLDSMSSTAGHSSQVIFSALKRYLVAERKYLRQQHDSTEEIKMDPSKAICTRKQVPLQDNEWDCGLFMLYYTQKFVSEVDAKGLDNLFGRDWFKPSEASELRGTILNILESIFTKEASQTCFVAEK